MNDLDKVISLLENHKTSDVELQSQIKKAISLIYQGLEFEESYKDYMAAENVLTQLNKTSSLKKDERWQTLADGDIPF